MSRVTILHNPRCSKSRQTLALLQEQGVEPDVIEYLKTPLTVDELRTLYSKLNLKTVTAMMRTKEAEFKQAGLDLENVSEDAYFQAMAETPKLLERPVVINGARARIGRPPEAVLEIL
ncbi:arsenate reductase (glutaredoxin) [Alteromonas aestuariivivens]|uniref:Arsenate reductase n=1 Tax=Alteromonas aestuariivivens TaxID=1938339 RepID=A0A3D8MBG2_9ALTE|nr:arsenate reductase (glutaredoxin) [Alteromonas aestuariivivens]RDV27588.1 arsenate reductase (glutaredoxin) [Alteromonas aestuariivivens]